KNPLLMNWFLGYLVLFVSMPISEAHLNPTGLKAPEVESSIKQSSGEHAPPPLHPFHTSVAVFRVKETVWQWEIRVFTDDLETTLRKSLTVPLWLGSDREIRRSDSVIAAYIPTQLQVEAKGKLIPFSYLGHEEKEDGTWLYLETQNVPPDVSEVRITQSLLMDTFSDQSNIVYVEQGGTRQTFLFSKDKEAKVVDW
ncbi:MAG: DUF6702 family protein, partial [Bacteroidota bacterium]